MQVESYCTLQMPLDVPRRFSHDACSKGKSPCLIITRTKKGWVYYCHRCEAKGLVPYTNVPPSQIKHLVAENETWSDSPSAGKIRLPDDFTTEIPPEGLTWLLLNGVDQNVISHHKIGYSRKMHRVILPVYRDGALVYYQGRYLGTPTKDHSKYVNISNRNRDDIYYEVLPHISINLVVVEDILSAIHVGRVVNTVALMGSYISNKMLLKLAKRTGITFIWLDHDKAKKAMEYVNRIRLLGGMVRQIDTIEDPKKVSEDQIRALIKV